MEQIRIELLKGRKTILGYVQIRVELLKIPHQGCGKTAACEGKQPEKRIDIILVALIISISEECLQC